VDAIIANRYHNYLNTAPFTLGTESRLRGYRFREFQGKDLVAANVEYRANSIDILSAQVGAALFYDSGDAFDGFDQLSPKQSVGGGVRILFPQADRLVMRGDWGFPLTPGFATWPGAWTITFGQAFEMPLVEEPSVTSSVLTD
jgi:outer membrane protein assembly factor BamA